MKSKTKYLLMWYISLLLLALSLIFFALLLLCRWRYPVLGICAVAFAVLFAALFLFCRKPLQCDDGYSLVQAITYYRVCSKAGCTVNTLQQNDQILLKHAEKENMEDFDLAQLQKCFKIGAKAVREIRNPFLQFLWKINR